MSLKVESIVETVPTTSLLRFDCLAKWLLWQENLHFTAIELGLERCHRVASKMSLLHPSYMVISIAGTNGKGSSATMLDQILRNAGYKVGCYTSPHLLRYNERICINGEQISDAKLCDSFDRIDRARGNISLTYFEFGTLAALDIFQQQDVELAILEVGLGGRLDAVNVLDADIALISSIDLDHQQWLGDDRESIAREKAGIFRRNATAICADPNPPQSLLDCANAQGTSLLIAGRDYHYHAEGDTWLWRANDIEHEALPRPVQYCDFQLQNGAGVLMVLEQIRANYPVSQEDIQDGFSNFHLAGRMQFVAGKVQKIMDVAHNHQAASALVRALKLIPCMGKTHLLIGMLQDKDYRAVFEVFSEIADSWNVVTLSPNHRGADAERLVAELATLNIQDHVYAFENVEAALAVLDDTAKVGDRIVITGSFLTVAAALRYLT